MTSITVSVASEVGLHARPAALIAQEAASCGAPVQISVSGGGPVDASSAMMLMTLDAPCGTPVTVTSECEDSARRIANLIATAC